MGDWENSPSFYLEFLDNYLHYDLILLILYCFWMSEEYLKLAIFGAKWGVMNFVAKIVQVLLY